MEHTILFVDDDMEALEYVKYHLEDSGYRVLTAHDGAKAIQIVRQTPDISLIVSDMQMPPSEWGGLWLVEQLQKQTRRVPIIILSERGTISKAVEAMKAGARNYVEKACLEDDLIPVIEEILLEQADIQERTAIEVTTYFASLQLAIGTTWMYLDDTTHKFLASGEHIYHVHSHDIHFDFSSAVIPFAKAFEHEFNRLFVISMKQWLVSRRSMGPNIRLLNSRMVPLTEVTEKLTIGQLSYLFRHVTAKNFCQDKGLSNADIQKIGEFLENLRSKYQRNEAAHTKFINRRSFEQLRSEVLGIGSSVSPFSYFEYFR
ncbi:response regulator [Paenibacillus sp. HWE-109]|uniref:response regulator n=1 Tax=Paenibacillus sp. HWE-109 TaxID=1306526 RepID=UPI001EDF1F3E|nr:response regulator [Paenibacillus sp. HWE-109]UKS25952.1 response regulator [Paenibacillus sp. HWE-109]